MLQGMALCWQATQCAVVIWETEHCRSETARNLLKTILGRAQKVVGHELLPLLRQLGLNLPEERCDDLALASSLLIGLRAHERCTPEELQARWALQYVARLLLLELCVISCRRTIRQSAVVIVCTICSAMALHTLTPQQD